MDFPDRYMVEMVIFGRVMADAIATGQSPRDAEKIATDAVKAIPEIIADSDSERGVTRLYFLGSLYGTFAASGMPHSDCVSCAMVAADKFHARMLAQRPPEPAAETPAP